MIMKWFSLSAPPQLITNKQQQHFKEEQRLTHEHMSAYKCEMKKRKRLYEPHLGTHKQINRSEIGDLCCPGLFISPIFFLVNYGQGIARTQSPLRKNYALESPAFGVIAGVSQTGVQWKGLALGGPPY